MGQASHSKWEENHSQRSTTDSRPSTQEFLQVASHFDLWSRIGRYAHTDRKRAGNSFSGISAREKSERRQFAILSGDHSALPGFTDLAVKLASRDVDFAQSPGNDEIMLTVVLRKPWNYDLPASEATLLFTENFLTQPQVSDSRSNVRYVPCIPC